MCFCSFFHVPKSLYKKLLFSFMFVQSSVHRSIASPSIGCFCRPFSATDNRCSVRSTHLLKEATFCDFLPSLLKSAENKLLLFCLPNPRSTLFSLFSRHMWYQRRLVPHIRYSLFQIISLGTLKITFFSQRKKPTGSFKCRFITRSKCREVIKTCFPKLGQVSYESQSSARHLNIKPGIVFFTAFVTQFTLKI